MRNKYSRKSKMRFYKGGSRTSQVDLNNNPDIAAAAAPSPTSPLRAAAAAAPRPRLARTHRVPNRPIIIDDDSHRLYPPPPQHVIANMLRRGDSVRHIQLTRDEMDNLSNLMNNPIRFQNNIYQDQVGGMRKRKTRKYSRRRNLKKKSKSSKRNYR